MGLKQYLLIVFLTIVLAGSAVYAQPPVSKEACDSDIGRYQLFQGTYTSIDLKRQQTSTHIGIFLIDTKTGKVKRYLNKIDEEGRYIETWLPTEIQQEK
ncbi:MAG: hypothetical protein AB1348_03090 [Nitrospirota bacterium]